MKAWPAGRDRVCSLPFLAASGASKQPTSSPTLRAGAYMEERSGHGLDSGLDSADLLLTLPSPDGRARSKRASCDLAELFNLLLWSRPSASKVL